MRALCYAQTNIGSGRDNNEDNYYCNGTFKRDPAIPVAEAAAEQESRRLIYGVFDGMGGEANGEQAALLCAQTLHQCSSDEPFDALDFFRRANVAVCDMIAASGQIGGSTAATVHLTGNRAYCCNVGDSRIYLQRGGALQRISRDHTKYQEQLDAGAAAADAADNPDRHVLTQYLGMLGARQRLMPYFAASVPLAVGDRLLLCTDGLTGKLSDSQLQAALGADLPLPELGQALMAQALAAGARGLGTGDDGDAAVTDADQLADGRMHAALVVRDDTVEELTVDLTVEQDHGDAECLKIVEPLHRIGVLLGDRRDDDAAQAVLAHGLQDLMLAVRIFCGVEQQNVIAPLISHPGDALEQQGEERVVDIRDDDADGRRGRGAERTGRAVGDVVELADGIHHAAVALFADRVAVIDDARDRCDGDTGLSGDLVDIGFLLSHSPHRPVPLFRPQAPEFPEFWEL